MAAAVLQQLQFNVLWGLLRCNVQLASNHKQEPKCPFDINVMPPPQLVVSKSKSPEGLSEELQAP